MCAEALLNNKKIKVLFITGSGRCGSTILHDLLGQINGFSAVGELRYIWERSFIKNSLCGCRVPFRECKFWRAVVHEAFGSIDHVDFRKMLYLTESFRIYHLPLILIPNIRRSLETRLSWYLDNLEKLYRAIRATTSSRVVIDSSKDPQYGYLLQKIPIIELYVLHVIRDPRAVAYSWSRKRRCQPGTGSCEYMEQYNFIRSSLQWNVRNIVAEVYLRKAPDRYMTLRYEDFIDKPQESVKSILSLLGETAVHLPFMSEHRANIEKVNHSVFGNPSRFRTGTVDLAPDKEWETKMLRKFPTMLLTWPLLLRYRYLA